MRWRTWASILWPSAETLRVALNNGFFVHLDYAEEPLDFNAQNLVPHS